MDRMIVAVFDSEKGAYEGARALEAMDVEGSIACYAKAVIAREPNGNVAVRQATDQGPVGTTLGMATGALVGLLGGPVGAAVRSRHRCIVEGDCRRAGSRDRGNPGQRRDI